MASTISVVIKVGSTKESVVFSVDEVAEFLIECGTGASSQTTVQLPGIYNPKFLVAIVDNYEEDVDPVTMRINESDAYPISCTPATVLMADVNGGFSTEAGGGSQITLYFDNPNSSEVDVKVIAGGDE